MRILITGGFGFIGGRLGQHLLASGHHVTLGTRNACESPAWLPGVKVTKIDWDNNLSLEDACDDIDVVVHAAGMNSRDCAEDPVRSLAFNGLATARLAKAAGSKGVRLFLYLSTAHVYADPLIGKISEDTCATNLHPYASSHRAGEDSVLGFRKTDIINGTVLRLSNAIGAPAHKDVNCWQLLVNDLCKQAVETKSLALYSTGNQHRDFIAMQDVCNLVSHLISLDSMQVPDIINVGSSHSRSILDMAKLIQDRCNVILGYQPPLEYPKPDAAEKEIKLKYQTHALERINFNLNNDVNSEIDNLLLFCRDNFHAKNK